ncbi:MAG: hypothetical protein KH354_03940 [Clostridiales bacterium]|nr:hypothetical protein [Clostridiales bacterium]
MKVDVSKIEGYEAMNAEQKLAALEAFEFETAAPTSASEEVERLKAALSKSNSEAADYKRQLRAKQTDEEAKALKEKEEKEQLIKEVESLRKDRAISKHKASYLSLGYDDTTAEANAKALYSGDFDTVFTNQKKFIEEQRKSAIAASLDKQPSLSSGNPLGGKESEAAKMAQLRKDFGLPV